MQKGDVGVRVEDGAVIQHDLTDANAGGEEPVRVQDISCIVLKIEIAGSEEAEVNEALGRAQAVEPECGVEL
jgi:hypothetical protein